MVQAGDQLGELTLDSAMSCGDLLPHRGQTETAEITPARENSLFCPWPLFVVVVTYWRSPACSVPGRKIAHSRDAATHQHTPGCSYLPWLCSPWPG